MTRNLNKDLIENDRKRSRALSASGVLSYFIATIAGLSLTFIAYFSVDLYGKKIQEEQFHYPAHLATDSVKQSLDKYLQILISIEALFATKNDINFNEFQEFINLETQNITGIHALEWIPRVKNEDKNSWGCPR